MAEERQRRCGLSSEACDEDGTGRERGVVGGDAVRVERVLFLSYSSPVLLRQLM